jgi:predicted porin
MKKSLFAIAAVTAFAGAAQAQSSVTVYGVMDIGYVGGNERMQVPTAGTRPTQQTYSGIGASAQSTSRIGFRGTEDLGGGTSAFFNFETMIQPNNGTFSNLQTRAANIGLNQKGIGIATVGTQNTVITDAVGPTNTGEFNNIVGSMIFASRTGPTALSGSGSTVGSTPNNNGNTDAFTFRTGSTLKLQSQRMAGLQASAMYVLNNVNSTITSATAGGENNQQGWGLGLNYQFKKLVVTGAYMSLKANQTANTTGVAPFNVAGQTGSPTAIGSTSTTSVSVGGVSGGTNVQDNQAYVGAMYDFGILKAYAGWVDRKVSNQYNLNQFAKRTAQEIGIRGNWTPKIQSWASVGSGRFQTYGTGEPTANIVGWQLGSNYIMSKRTNLYAIYGANGTSNASRIAGGQPASFNANNYAVGMRHTF